MPIDPPLPNDTRSRLADWVEVESLIRARGAGSGDLIGLYRTMHGSEHDLHRDEATGERLETEILEEQRILFAEQVLAEIEYRGAVLAADYPFVLEGAGNHWRIYPEPDCVAGRSDAPRCCYVFCLLASALRDDCIRGVRGADLKRLMERLFQAVAVDAAAAIMHGEVISFGLASARRQQVQNGAGRGVSTSRCGRAATGFAGLGQRTGEGRRDRLDRVARVS